MPRVVSTGWLILVVGGIFTTILSLAISQIGANDDFHKAVREIVEFGGALTRNLLGFQDTGGTNQSRIS